MFFFFPLLNTYVAFTELQTDMELVYDRSDQHLPFLDFRTFAMRVLFPHDMEHIVLQPLTVSGSSGGVGEVGGGGASVH